MTLITFDQAIEAMNNPNKLSFYFLPPEEEYVVILAKHFKDACWQDSPRVKIGDITHSAQKWTGMTDPIEFDSFCRELKRLGTVYPIGLLRDAVTKEYIFHAFLIRN